MTTDQNQLYAYDPAEALTCPEAIAEFMTDAFASGDAGYIAKASGVEARARGPGRRGFPVSSSSVRSARKVTRH